MKNPLPLFLIFSFIGLSLSATEITPDVFLHPSSHFAKPGSTFVLQNTKEDSLFRVMRELDRAKEIGIGTILITLPREDQNFWQNWRMITKRAQRLNLQIGFTDFSLQGETNGCSSCSWEPKFLGSTTNLTDWLQQHPPKSNELARIAQSRATSQIIDLPGVGTQLPALGLWEITGFLQRPATYQVSIPFHAEKFGAHINKILSKSQAEIARQYDITVKWYHFPAVIPPTQFWPLGEERLLRPSRYWQFNTVRQCWEPTPLLQEKSRILWADTFAGTIRDLVQEAGLEASMDIASTPLLPEELSTYFKRPIFSLATNPAEQLRNLRVSSGGRAMDRPKIIGRLPWPLPPSETGPLHTFPWKAFADSLLADGATHILLDLPNGLPGDDQSFREMKIGCEYLHRCQRLLEIGSYQQDFLFIGDIPLSLRDRYSIDSITPAMLQGVRIKNRELVLPSEWSYRRLLVDPRETKNNPKLLQKLIKFSRAGLPVALCGIEQKTPISPVQNLKVIRSLSELKLPPKVTIQSDNAKLSIRWIHKQNGKQGVYFLVNSSNQSGNVRITFRNPAYKILGWDPEETEIQPLAVQNTRSCLFFMEPAESLFLIVE